MLTATCVQPFPHRAHRSCLVVIPYTKKLSDISTMWSLTIFFFLMRKVVKHLGYFKEK